MNTFAASMLLLGLALTLVLSAVSTFVFRPPGDGTRPLTRFLLVALRLSIGWHFFVEGMDKLNSPSWSSEAYLREATGPLAPEFRDLAGERLIDKLTVPNDGSFPAELDLQWRTYVDELGRFYELDADRQEQAAAVLEQHNADTLAWLTSTPKTVQAIAPYPPALTVALTMPRRLQTYRDLAAEVRDIEEVQLPKYGPEVFAQLKAAKAGLNKWRGELKSDLDQKTLELKLALRDQVLVAVAISALPAEDQRKALEARLREQEAKVQALEKDDAAKKAYAAKYGKDGAAQLATAKANLAKARAELKGDFAKQTTEDRKTAADQILSGNAIRGLPAEYHLRPTEAKEPLLTLQTQYHQLLLKKNAGADVTLTPQAARVFEYAIDRKKDKQDPNEVLPTPPGRPLAAWTMLDWSDFLVKWGITLTGALLLLGLLTRTSCVVGALLLLSFFLAMPPLPGWPESPRAEGHYLYVNKNIIEMLALLTLATTRSGRWAGLDGLLQFLRPRRWQNAEASSNVERAVSMEEAPTVAIDPATKDETRHMKN